MQLLGNRSCLCDRCAYILIDNVNSRVCLLAHHIVTGQPINFIVFQI